MNYPESLAIMQGLTKFGINLGLERIRSLLDHFDNPQDRLRIIHIGGTNGKGSTTAMISSILKEAGYKVGTYTSPHLVSYTERVMIDGQPIPEPLFASLLEELLAVFEQVKEQTGECPTEFEVLTALAFLYFSRSHVDVVVLEVGLGGDIDSTNVVKSPLVSIITNVAMDHMDYLGYTVEEIAEKKSGIIKTGRPVITASEDNRVLKVLRAKSQELHSPFHQVAQEVTWRHLSESEAGQHFSLRMTQVSQVFTFDNLFIPLQGAHQLVNAATSILAIGLLAEMGWQVKEAAIRRGLELVRWPGRLEIIRKDPLVVIDGAHNPAGLQVLSEWLAAKRKQVDRVILVMGMLADKDRAQSVSFVDPLVDTVVITRPLSPRAGNWQELAHYFHQENREIRIIEDLSQALQSALNQAGPLDLVLVCGSLYLIGEARRLLLNI